MSADPSKMTDTELHTHVTAMVRNGMEELDRYFLILDEDLLTTGTTRFQKKLMETRAWANRVLGMLGEARRLNNLVAALLRGKKSLLEARLAMWTQGNKDSLKGLDASERKAVAIQNNGLSVEDRDRWEDLASEIRSFIATLDDRHRDLLNARNDLRALAWSVRLQGVLGELSREGQEDLLGNGHTGLPLPPVIAAPVTVSPFPTASIAAPTSEMQLNRDPDIDKLLDT